MKSSSRIFRELCSEIVGTFLLAFCGLGAVHAAVLTGAQSGLWQVAVVFGLGISLAIYATGAVSGAHMNPAMTIAFTLFRRFDLRKVVPYILAQTLGAFLAAALLYAMFGPVLADFEAARHLVRGQPGSELSACVYGMYFPNPDILAKPGVHDILQHIGLPQACAAEVIGTALLAFFVLAMTDGRNPGRPGGALTPFLIGLTIAVIISITGPISMTGLNPARDFGPRLFSYFAGWGDIAIPGPQGHGFISVYILSPILGAIAGGAVYTFIIRPGLPAETEPSKKPVRETQEAKL